MYWVYSGFFKNLLIGFLESSYNSISDRLDWPIVTFWILRTVQFVLWS